MKYYFQIQLRRIIRHLKDFGINPLLGFIFIACAFFVLSWLLFHRLPEYAPLGYLFFATNALLLISNTDNREFLQLSFTQIEFRQIRIIENLVVSLPFLLFLLYFREWSISFLLLLIMLITAFYHRKKNTRFSFRTPFSKHPFEFSRGFRTSILIYPISYGLAVIGMVVGNMNLAVAGIVLLGVSAAHYYSFAEPDFYIWVYQEGSSKMIQTKMKKGLLNLFIMICPIVFATSLFEFEGLPYQLLTTVFVMLLLVTNIVLKYAYFPRSIEMIQAILLPLLFLFPPLLFILIPYYYHKAKQQLKYLTAS